MLVLCFAVFLGTWSPISLSIGYRQSGGVAVPAPSLNQMSSMGPAGPAVKDATVDAYSTPNCKYIHGICSPNFCCLTLSCPGTGRAILKIGHSILKPGSKELMILNFIIAVSSQHSIYLIETT